MTSIIHFHFENEELRELAYAIRTEVFVKEQKVDPELEYDEFEEISHHYLLFHEDKAVGTARWRETPKGIKLERFAVLADYRNKKLGKEILKEVLNDTLPLNKSIYLHSQTRAVPFYESHGFIKGGEPFFEAGIEHYLMNFKNDGL